MPFGDAGIQPNVVPAQHQPDNRGLDCRSMARWQSPLAQHNRFGYIAAAASAGDIRKTELFAGENAPVKVRYGVQDVVAAVKSGTQAKAEPEPEGPAAAPSPFLSFPSNTFIGDLDPTVSSRHA